MDILDRPSVPFGLSKNLTHISYLWYDVHGDTSKNKGKARRR